MLEHTIDTIRQGIPGILSKSVNENISNIYIREWDQKIEQLLQVHSSRTDLFRELLTFTNQLNGKFRLSQLTRRELNNLIYQTFVQPVEAEPDAKSSPRQTASDLAKLPAKNIVFRTMIEGLNSRYDGRIGRAGMMKTELKTSADRSNLSSGAKIELSRWITSEYFSGTFEKFSENEMRSVIDLIYNLYCDEFGPSETDLIFSETAKAVEQIKESRLFSVRSLL